MGLLIDGVWRDQWYDTASAGGRFSLAEFSRRGGLAGPHKDDWGLAYYADGDALFLHPRLGRGRNLARNARLGAALQHDPPRRARRGGGPPELSDRFERGC